MKYDERTYKFNMDTGCVELLLRDGRKIFIDCTRVEDRSDRSPSQKEAAAQILRSSLLF